jgi:hypothetical protein
MSRRQSVTTQPWKPTGKQTDETPPPKSATPPPATIQSIPRENVRAPPKTATERAKTADALVRTERSLAPIGTEQLTTATAIRAGPDARSWLRCR